MSPIECTPSNPSDVMIIDGETEAQYWKFNDGKKHTIKIKDSDLHETEIVGYPEKGGIVNKEYREVGRKMWMSDLWIRST